MCDFGAACCQMKLAKFCRAKGVKYKPLIEIIPQPDLPILPEQSMSQQAVASVWIPGFQGEAFRYLRPVWNLPCNLVRQSTQPCVTPAESINKIHNSSCLQPIWCYPSNESNAHIFVQSGAHNHQGDDFATPHHTASQGASQSLDEKRLSTESCLGR